MSFDTVSAAALLLGAILPVFDEKIVWPGVGTVSALIAAMFWRARDTALANLATVAIIAAMLRVAQWLNPI